MKVNQNFPQRVDILQQALHLGVGETDYQLRCPFCSRQEGNFSVTRQEFGVLYNCFRAKCGEHGMIAASMGDYNVPDTRDTPKKPKKVFQYDRHNLTKSQRDYFREKFNLTPKQIRLNNLQYSEELNRIIIPLYNKQGYEFAVNARVYPEIAAGDSSYAKQTKSILYFHEESSDIPVLHYPKPLQEAADSGGDSVHVLVEDQISALRFNEYWPTVALMGTTLSKAGLTQFLGTNVVVCLDGDALRQGFKIKNDNSLFFKSCNVLDIGEVDIKDKKEEDLIDLSNEIKNLIK